MWPTLSKICGKWPLPSAVQILLIVVGNCPTACITSSILWNCLPQRGSFIFSNRSGLHKLNILGAGSFLLPPHAKWSCASLAKWQCTLSCGRNDGVPLDADDAPQMLCRTLQWQSNPLRPYGGWHNQYLKSQWASVLPCWVHGELLHMCRT
jgi:hypothetical protein